MMFCSPEIKRKAAKQHQCSWCAEPIFAGENYLSWMSVDDDRHFSNSKAHPECLDAIRELCAECGEYTPYSGERPK